MRAMQLQRTQPVYPDSEPLTMASLDVPRPKQGEVLIRVEACGVCHTELDEIEGRATPPWLPVTPGHQVVGHVEETGPACCERSRGERVGVGWIGGACGHCEHCKNGAENLCPDFVGTGRDIHGGYADYLCVDEHYAHPIPDRISSLHAAPMLCAGAIGYRALSLANIRRGQALGLTGFGGSAHLVLQLARALLPDSPVFVFAREEKTQRFARELGADWAGSTDDRAPQHMAAIIDTTPAWRPVTAALAQLSPGGRLVINAIRKEAQDKPVLLDIEYQEHLWMEKEIKSVANVTREDIRAFLSTAAAENITPEIECFALEDANRALCDLKHNVVRGAKVLQIQ